MKNNRWWAVLVAGLTCLVAACTLQTSEGDEESVGEIRSAVTYDTLMVKPLPKFYLSKKTTGNICCGGVNQGGSNCADACADSKGLVTAAGYAKAFDYYRATGQDTLDTLDKWKDFFKFPKRLPNETLTTYRQRVKAVVYYNRTELGLGRELACAQDGAVSIACYVTNYGDSFGSVHDLLSPDTGDKTGLAYARSNSAQPKNTVVISYDTRREITQYDGLGVQFAAFGPDGKRLQKAQLDDQGARPIPQICMTCHGGVWDADARAANGVSVPFAGAYYGASRFARFLPLVTSTVTFSNISPYTQTEQEVAIKEVNQAAWRARGTGLTSRQRLLLGWLYSATSNGDGLALNLRRAGMMIDNLSFTATTPTSQYAANAWPGGWSASKDVYNKVALPFCDTCHMAMDASTSWKDMAGNALPVNANRKVQLGLTYGLLQSLTDSRASASTLAAYMGIGLNADATPKGIFNTDRSTLTMPHAQQTFTRFWSDKSGVGFYNCTLNGVKVPPGDCLAYELGIWPNGRAAPKTAGYANGIDWTALAPSVNADCGQSIKTPLTTSGTNAGRRMGGVALPAPLDTTFVNQCIDGCTSSALCPGSETAGQSPPFPGARQECIPNAVGASFGSCVSCGRIGEPACAQVGAACDTNLNPNCNNLPACHEGIAFFGTCNTLDLTHNGQASATQSSTGWAAPASRAIDGNYSGAWNSNSVTHSDPTTDTTPWWKVDLSATKKVKSIVLFNRTDCCSGRLGNFVVESSTDNATWTLVPTGDFTGVFPTTADNVAIIVPKAIDARYIRVRHLAGGLAGDNNIAILSLAEVSVNGW